MVVSLSKAVESLVSDSRLNLIEASIGGWRLCGASVHRNAAGALAVKKLRASPPQKSLRAQHNRSWFEADEALITSDLSQVQGGGRVRLGLGSITIEGESFTLLPEARTLLLERVCFRTRDPLVRLSAERLRARFEFEEGAEAPRVQSFELIGAVHGSLVLPWRESSLKFDVRADRLAFRNSEAQTIIDIVCEENDAELRSRDGSIEARTRGGRLTLAPNEINFDGALYGSAALSGASLLNNKERTRFHITGARGFSVTASAQDEPTWWSGETSSCNLNRITFHDASCGERSFGRTLVFQEPGYAHEN